MGLFTTVLHIYKTNQGDAVNALKKELQETYQFSKFSKLEFNNDNYEKLITDEMYYQEGIFYLLTEQHGDWLTIIELNVNIENPFYLYELTANISKALNTYALSFHLHDDDILYFNLDKNGESLDGYNSNYQYFLNEPADKDEIISQRHTLNDFVPLLKIPKTIDGLNSILNEGYWNAFDNNQLDEDGVPNDDKYFIDEEDRFVRVGKYLELYNANEYPFANWHVNLHKLKLSSCYLLKAEL